MNPKFLQHLIGWVLFLGYDYIDYFSSDGVDFDSTLLIISHDIILISIFYIIYLRWAPWLFKDFTFLKALMISVGGIIMFVLIRYLIQEVLFDLLFGFRNYYNNSFWFFAMDNLWRGFMPVIGGVFIFLIERRITNEKDQLKLKQEKTAAELSNLRSQINPHFLFNTLSFLHAEAYSADPQLADTILKLSDVLRHSVESSKVKLLPLESEVNLLKNYIGIFEKRFEGKFFIEFQNNGKGLDLLIEPLLLLPFVENAFKHGVISDQENPVRISLKYENGKLDFKCVNKINHQTKDAGSGIGISNVRKRLEILYPGKFDLQLVDKDDFYTVRLLLTL